jgi:gluconolactonase
MRSLLLSPVLVIAIGCGSSDDSNTIEDAGSTEETHATTDTASDDSVVATDSAAPTDTSVDAPDWSKVNPIGGSPIVKKLKGGFGFTEGTAWNTAGGYLLFTDIPNSRIHKLVPPSTFTVLREPSGKANGLAWDPMGRLVACEHGNRRVSRTESDGSVVPIAEQYMGNKLNSPNDAIVRSDGTVYFTDPTYGLEGRTQELAFKGVFRVSPTGALSLVDDKMNQPNGIALSPDEKILYVGDSGSPITHKWTVNTDGTVSGKTKFVDSGTDGIAIDDAGNVYLTNGGNVRVYKPDGTSWGNVAVPEGPANVAFGGADRKTLFIAARTSIYSVDLAIPGKP